MTDIMAMRVSDAALGMESCRVRAVSYQRSSHAGYDGYYLCHRRSCLSSRPVRMSPVGSNSSPLSLCSQSVVRYAASTIPVRRKPVSSHQRIASGDIRTVLTRSL